MFFCGQVSFVAIAAASASATATAMAHVALVLSFFLSSYVATSMTTCSTLLNLCSTSLDARGTVLDLGDTVTQRACPPCVAAMPVTTWLYS